MKGGQNASNIRGQESDITLSIEDLAFFGTRNYRQFKSSLQIEREFDQWAFGSDATNGFTYDDLAHLFQYNAPQKLADLTLPFFERFPESPQILDIGCGTGKSGWPYIERGYTVDGLDLSGKMVTAAQERGYKNVLKHDIAKPLSMPASYDVALSIGVICEYVPPSRAIPNIIDVLKQQAVIAIASEMQGQDWRYIQQQLLAFGFKLDSFTLALGYKPIKGLQKMYTYLVGTRGF